MSFRLWSQGRSLWHTSKFSRTEKAALLVGVRPFLLAAFRQTSGSEIREALAALMLLKLCVLATLRLR
jgi:hypothetical protein